MLTINISETIWTVLCFLILFVGLDKILYKPMLRFMDERKQRIDEGFAAQSGAEQAVREIEDEMHGRCEELALRTKEQLALAEAKSERQLDTLVAQEKAEARRERQLAAQDDGGASAMLRSELPALSVRLAEKILEN